MELAGKLRSGINLPEGVPQSLDVKHVSDGPRPPTYPNGCHVCEVEIDPDTGVDRGGEIHRRSTTSAP